MKSGFLNKQDIFKPTKMSNNKTTVFELKVIKSLLTYFFILYSFQSFAQLPKVVGGSINRIDSFPSKYVTPRNVDIWFPDGYSSGKKYSVLYMHDGQMLFDSATTWNKQSWDVDDILTKLLKEKKIKDVIVVGIWNGGATRHADYFPQKPFKTLSLAEQDSIYFSKRTNGASVFNGYNIKSDNYLKFLVKELKVYIDKNYSTYRDRKNTFIAGSSMGGLISMYAICEYPNVFGGAACLSTHWPGIFTLESNPIPTAFLGYLKKHLPKPKNHRIYFDFGDQTLDAMYPALQEKVDKVMVSNGFTSKNWITKYFAGDDHSEKAWSKRFDIPLLFLLKN